MLAPVPVDAHIHFIDLAERDPGFAAAYTSGGYLACAASHDAEEYRETMALRRPAPARPEGLRFAASFGIHPQWPVWTHADFLAERAAAGEIDAIGESGFDFFGDRPERVRTEENERIQRAVFEFQLELALAHGLPMVLHLRKATDLLFAYAPRLKRLPALILHAYAGTAQEALDLLKRGVPAWFSFGAAVLNGHKRAIAACAALPVERILPETDAPWQPPRGEPFCKLEHITRIERGIEAARGVPPGSLEEVFASSFHTVFPHLGAYARCCTDEGTET